MKKSYYVTEDAGKTVAGLSNPGTGREILLTEKQAEHPLRLGHISHHPLDHDGDGRKGGSKAKKAAE